MLKRGCEFAVLDEVALRLRAERGCEAYPQLNEVLWVHAGEEKVME